MLSTLLLAAVLSQTEVAPPPPPAVEVAAEPLVPPAFFDDVLAWDLETNQAIRGRQRTVLSRAEFFEQVGRLDLVEKSNALRTRRIALVVAASTVAAGGVIGGVILLAGAPDMNSPYCVENVNNFNQCHETNRVHQNGGFGLIAGSLAIAMLMGTIAWWSSPDAIDGDEAIHLVSQYNAGLLKRLRASKGSLRWMPVISPDGAAVAVAGRF